MGRTGSSHGGGEEVLPLSLIGLLGFATVVLLAVLLLHSYLWWRLVRSTTRPGRTRRLLTLGVVVLAALPMGAVLLRREDSTLSTVVQWIGFSWLGIAFYLFLTLLVLEPVRLLLRHRSRGVADRPEARREPASGEEDGVLSPSRRLLLARGVAVTAGAVALGTAGTGAYLANSAPVVRRVPITLAGLDPALEGLRIVTFSDGHLSALYGGRRFERLVEIVNAQRPDVVAIVGDLVDGELGELREEVAPLADLVSEQGVYFVTGNHEYFVDTTAWLRHLPTLGVQVLRNERVPIVRGGASVDLAGIDDRTAVSSGGPGGRAAAVRAHARRPAVALRLRGAAGPAGRAGVVPGGGHPALRHDRSRLLGAADADRRPARGRGRRAARPLRLRARAARPGPPGRRPPTAPRRRTPPIAAGPGCRRTGARSRRRWLRGSPSRRAPGGP